MLESRETDSNSENVNVSDKNVGEKVYIYIYQSVYGQVKGWYNEGLFDDFCVTNGTIWIKEYEYSKPMDVTHMSDL